MAIRKYVSPLGWAVAGMFVLTLALFLCLGWVEMLAFALVCATLLVSSAALSVGNTAFTATLSVSNTRVSVNQTMHAMVTVSNPSTSVTASASGDLPISQSNYGSLEWHHERFAIPSLGAHQSKQTAIPLTATHRAVVTVGPLSVRKGDPFGLVRREHRLTEQIRVYIHPDIVPLHTLHAGIIRDLEGNPSDDLVNDDLSFFGLREYEYGDDVRNVHWLSTAKTGTLMIRQFEATRRTDSSVSLDVAAFSYASAEEFELAVSVFASIGVQCVSERRALYAQSGRLHVQPRKPADFLDTCSEIEPETRGGTMLANLAREALLACDKASLYCFVAGSAHEVDDLRRLGAAIPDSATCVVVHAAGMRVHHGRRARRPSATHGGALMTSPTSSFGATRHGRTRGDASWINDNSTQMPVWLTMNARDARRADAAHAAGHATRDAAISLVVVMAIVLCACANLIDVYGSAGSWARAAIPAALLGSGIAFMTLVPRLRFWWQILASVLAQCVIGPLVALPHTSVAYVLPTWQTLAEGCSAMFTSFKFLIAVPAPTGTADGSLMAVWTLCLLSCTLGGVLAVLPQRRWSALSVLVVIGDFAVCALLGTSAGVLRLPCGVVCALAAVVWLSWRWRLFEMSRWLGAGALLLLAGAVAVGACLPVHATRTILRDHYEPPLAPFDYASPMSGMRAYLKEHKADTLLTVRNLPAGASVRLAVMDRFDGNVWNLSNTRIAGASSNYTRMGLRITQDGDDSGTWFTAMFDVRDGMRDDWLPLAGAATQVTFATNANADDFYYNTGTESGLLTSGVRSGLAYTETGTLARRPSDDEIRQTQAARIALPAHGGGLCRRSAHGWRGCARIGERPARQRVVLARFGGRLPFACRAWQLPDHPAARRHRNGGRQRTVCVGDGPHGEVLGNPVARGAWVRAQGRAWRHHRGPHTENRERHHNRLHRQ